ncbi:fungal-specific transcription factor domain-containing protein, partial [Lineolata rhizophorae]
MHRIRSEHDVGALAQSLQNGGALPRSCESDPSFDGSPSSDLTGATRSGLGLVPGTALHLAIRAREPPQHEGWTTVTRDADFIDELMELYFSWSHPFSTLFSQEYFVHDFRTGDTQFCSSILVNAVLSYGCLFSHRPEARKVASDASSAGEHFYDEFRRLLFEDDNASSLTTTQALGIISLREASVGKESSGFQYVGRCLRMAVELGLHLNFSTTLSEAEVKARSVTFWGCFTLENIWSLCIGRVVQLPRHAIEIEKPGRVADGDAQPWRPYYDESGAGDSRAGDGPPANEFAFQLSHLSEIVNDLVHMFFAPKDRLTARKVGECYAKFKAWSDRLPTSFQLGSRPSAHLIALHMYYHLCLLHLFRPLVQFELKGMMETPRDICRRAASSITALFDSHRSLYGLRHINLFLTHIQLSASIVHLMFQPTDPEVARLVQGFRDLQDMSRCHLFAARGLEILHGISAKWGIALPRD